MAADRKAVLTVATLCVLGALEGEAPPAAAAEPALQISLFSSGLETAFQSFTVHQCVRSKI